MVEQNAKQALSISDRGYGFGNGENRYSGTGKELLNDPRVRSSFSRRLTMDFIKCDCFTFKLFICTCFILRIAISARSNFCFFNLYKLKICLCFYCWKINVFWHYVYNSYLLGTFNLLELI